MWLLQFIPSWIFYGMVLIGAIAYTATYLLRFFPIPTLYIYKNTIQWVSIAVMVIFTFLSGAVYDNDIWLAKIKDLEEKVAKAEEQSKEANEKIDAKVEKEKIKIVEKQVVLKQYVDREVVKYDNSCIIPKEFIDVVNRSTDDVRK